MLSHLKKDRGWMVPILCQSLPKSVPKQVLHVISDQFKVNWISGLENKINTKKKDNERDVSIC